MSPIGMSSASGPSARARNRPNQLAASVSLAYNIGTTAFCRSTVARRFNAGQWKAGCDAFLMWDRAGGRKVRGLTRRREAERAICLRGLTSP
jgi:lysozyme